MKFRYIALVLIIPCIGQVALGQDPDSLRSRQLGFRTIAPATLIAGGIVINGSAFEKEVQAGLMSWVGEDFHSDIDDYFQYVPIAQLYLADVLGVKSKNHWFDHTKYLLISNLFTASITQGLKKLTLKERPNGAPYAFPSGHSTFAFTNATVLFNEFCQTAPLLAGSGYAFAATTGFFRMLNNRHWLSDVMVGAGIGILVTELVYYFEPFKAFNPFKKSGAVAFVPRISANEYGFYFSCDL